MENIYQKLLEAVEKLPEKAVERANKEITRKGYDTSGYQYMFLVNVLNDVVGIGSWGFNYTIIKETQGSWSNGKPFWEITTDVEVWIKIDNERVSFHGAGGHKSEMHADALKGAITNGFKKTVAFFGVGKKAYEGTIDDDYRAPYRDNSFSSIPKKPVLSKLDVSGKKKRIAELLESLMIIENVATATKTEIETAVLRATDLPLLVSNYDEIISRLEALEQQ